MAKFAKTPKGTELPILSLRGKDYLEVKYRIVWFREEHPDWSIETDLLSVTDVSAYAKATIRDDKGRIIATSHKFESVQGFPDFIEKSETGSIGRALALIGYGTQFCGDELQEGTRIVDSPVTQIRPPNKPQQIPQNLGEYVIPFGRKYKGKKLNEIPNAELLNYITWLKTNGNNEGGSLKQFFDIAEAYLAPKEG